MEMQSQGAGTGEATLWAARVGLGLALIGLIMEVASGWGYRHGWWGLRVALRYLFAYGGVVAIVACVVSLVVLALAIGTKSRGAALALLGVVAGAVPGVLFYRRSEEHTSELQSRLHLVCRLLLEKKKKTNRQRPTARP